MNRDSKGMAKTDRAPNQPGGGPGGDASSNAPLGHGSTPNAPGQPPSNPQKQKDESSTSTSSRKSLKDIAQDKLDSGNASQLGDPVSMKAETADSKPTDQDRGAQSSSGGSKKEQAKQNLSEGTKTAPTEGQGEKGGNGSKEKSLKEIAQDKLDSGNASQLGDPVSMKAETADSEPTEQDRGAMSEADRKKRGSKL